MSFSLQRAGVVRAAPGTAGNRCGVALVRRSVQHRGCTVVVSSSAEASTEASTSGAPEAVPTVAVKLRKPVGIVFAQKPNGGPVYVDELTKGGAAEATGVIAVGDVLTKCSAVVLKAGKETGLGQGHGDRPYDNFERVVFDCEGQDFKTVMSALKSNNERWGFFDVEMIFRKP